MCDDFCLIHGYEHMAKRSIFDKIAHCAVCEREAFAAELAAKQERLGPEFEKALFDNLPDLYSK